MHFVICSIINENVFTYLLQFSRLWKCGSKIPFGSNFDTLRYSTYVLDD